MRLSTRQRGYFDAFGVLICEVVLLATLLKAGSLLGTVDLAHFATWLQATSPQRVVTAVSVCWEPQSRAGCCSAPWCTGLRH